MEKKTTKNLKITKDTKISQAIKSHPKMINLFLNHDLHCAACPISDVETIEQGAQGHGMSQEQIDSMLKDIDKLIESSD